MTEMLKRKSLPRLLLLLTFVVSQWLAVVHATQHELAPDEQSDCELCSYSHADGIAFALPTLPHDLSPKSAPPPILPAIHRPSLRAARPRSRAPPLSLA